MALFLFTKAIIEGRPINVFNHGQMIRDFTYIDDIAEGVVRVLDRTATGDEGYDPVKADPARSSAPYRVFNIGNHAPIQLMSFIEAIEKAVGREAVKNYMPMQDGDVPATHADVEELAAWTGFRPAMPVPEGITRFVAWYRDYYKV
jgi:UDP-glucuronate 4-epimerase